MTSRESLTAIATYTARFATAFAAETEGQTGRIREVTRRMLDAAAIADTAARGAQQASVATERHMASLGELAAASHGQPF